jgi:hypothetical protein
LAPRAIYSQEKFLVPTNGVSVCGRFFTNSDIALIDDFIERHPTACRSDIAAWTAQALGWISPNGRLKEMSCRVALLKLAALGEIHLPPPRKGNGNRKPFQAEPTIAVPESDLFLSLGDLPGLQLRPVESREDSRLWNEAIHRFHYLGYKRLPGAQLRYLLEAREFKGGNLRAPSSAFSGQPNHTAVLLGVLGWGASAWKVAPRDRWIGWTDSQRKERLQLIVNNARFLILPWVRCQNLASWALSQCARRLPLDWERRYAYRPVLLETFVECQRFKGSCYKAANWKYLGETQGRGKLDRYRRRELPVKQILVYPLRHDCREVLCS